MSAMVVLAAMLRRCPYGPNRGLKKPRGMRAKAEVRRQARHIAHVRAAARARRGDELGTIEAVEHGVLHVRMPDGALERIEVHDPEGWFVVDGIVSIGGVKARAR